MRGSLGVTFHNHRPQAVSLEIVIARNQRLSGGPSTWFRARVTDGESILSSN